MINIRYDKNKAKVFNTEQEDNFLPETTNLIQPNELSETIKELNSDELDKGTRLSGIDMKTRLYNYEIPPILVLNALISFKLLPVQSSSLIRSKERLVVSRNGLGREEIVKIVRGIKEDESIQKQGFFKRYLGIGK